MMGVPKKTLFCPIKKLFTLPKKNLIFWQNITRQTTLEDFFMGHWNGFFWDTRYNTTIIHWELTWKMCQRLLRWSRRSLLLRESWTSIAGNVFAWAFKWSRSICQEEKKRIQRGKYMSERKGKTRFRGGKSKNEVKKKWNYEGEDWKWWLGKKF